MVKNYFMKMKCTKNLCFVCRTPSKMTFTLAHRKILFLHVYNMLVYKMQGSSSAQKSKAFIRLSMYLFHSFIRSFVCRSLIRSFFCSTVVSFIRSFVRSFVCSFACSFVRSFVLMFFRSLFRSSVLSFFRYFVISFVRSFVRSFLRSFVCSFDFSFNRSFVGPFVCLFTYRFCFSLGTKCPGANSSVQFSGDRGSLLIEMLSFLESDSTRA